MAAMAGRMMGGYGFAPGAYSGYLEQFDEYKRGKGDEGGHSLLSAYRKIGVQLSGESEAFGLGKRKARPLLWRLEGKSDA